MDFSDWLLSELKMREWSQADLSRKSGIASPHITRVLKRQQNPGNVFCEGIARAFDIPIESVMRQANILPPSSDNNDPWVIATQRQLAQLTPESRDIADTLIKALRDREKGQHKK